MFAKTKAWYKKNKLEVIITCILTIMLIILLIRLSIVTIDPGQAGVRWHRLFNGTELDRTYQEGTRFMMPWDKMYLYNLRLQKLTSEFNVLAKNGVNVDIEVTFHYRPNTEKLPRLHKYIGEDYVKVLILPKIGSHVRELFSKYEPEELFSVHREMIEQQLLINVRDDVVRQMPTDDKKDIERVMQYVRFENIFITSIVLPDRVVEAIETKETTKQQAMAYRFRIEIEQQEKIRKKLEAEGIRDFQQTINDGISEKYLAWKGIEATLKLAESTNAKVVVIGSAKDGLPIILGGEYTASQAPQPAKEEAKTPKPPRNLIEDQQTQSDATPAPTSNVIAPKVD